MKKLLLLLFCIYTTFSVAQNAGIDETICNSSHYLNAQNPFPQNGKWETVTGGATISNATFYYTQVNGLSFGTNVFRWTVNGSFDEVSITRVYVSAVAGNDQVICNNSTQLHAANLTGTATGEWRMLSGNCIVTHPYSPNTNVYNLSTGANIFIWKVTDHDCTATDTVMVTNNGVYANAGNDQEICGNSATLNASKSNSATGYWSVYSSCSGIIISSSTSNITNISGLKSGCPLVLKFHVSANGCTADDYVTIYTNKPTQPSIDLNTSVSAGDWNEDFNNRLVCNTSTILQGTTPEVYEFGQWTIGTGYAQIVSPTMYQTTFKNIQRGPNVIRWTITRGSCTAYDEVTITSFAAQANAGSDKEICSNSVTLQATTPFGNSTGEWIRLSGTGAIASVFSTTTTITNLSGGSNMFIWKVTDNICTAMDTVIINNNSPSVASVNNGDTKCVNYADLHAVPPTDGSVGLWSVYAGGGSIVNPFLFSTQVNNMLPGLNIYKWTVTKGSCAVFDTVWYYNHSIQADAGVDKEVCGPVLGLSANNLVSATGSWSLLCGWANFDDPLQYNTTVRNIQKGNNVFRWSVSYNGCTSMDDITVTNLLYSSDAGTDQNLCQDFSDLGGNIPVGAAKGFWSVVGGQALFENSTSNSTKIYNLANGKSVLRWTVDLKGCQSYDDVTITNNNPTKFTNAGTDKLICIDSTQLGAMDPYPGKGKWSMQAGVATFANQSLNTTKVYNLQQGYNVFRWTVTNAGCSAYDDVMIAMNKFVISMPNEQNVCSTTADLQAPSLGLGAKGLWSIQGGSGAFGCETCNTTKVTGLVNDANTFRWTVVERGCSAFAEVKVVNDLYTSIAGTSQVVCNDFVHMNASNPKYGVGEWIVLSGSGIFSFNITGQNDPNNITSPKAYITNLSPGLNRFRWTLQYNNCISYNDVDVINNKVYYTAGLPQTVCTTTAGLYADNMGSDASNYVGKWIDVTGNATFSNPTYFVTTVSGVNPGFNRYGWHLVNKKTGCSALTYAEVYSNYFETKADAHYRDNIYLVAPSGNTCNTTLDAQPVLGVTHQEWIPVAGHMTIQNITDPKTVVTNIQSGKNILKFTVKKNGCESSDFINIYCDNIELSSAVDSIAMCTDTVGLQVFSTHPGKWSVVKGFALFVNDTARTTIAKYLPTNIENILRWTSSENGLTKFVDFHVWNKSFNLMGSQDQQICLGDTLWTNAEKADLIQEVYDNGVGEWKRFYGNATIGNYHSEKTHFIGMSYENIFIWEVTRWKNFVTGFSGCVARDTIEVQLVTKPTVSAGVDQISCDHSTTLQATYKNANQIEWSVLSGFANFSVSKQSITQAMGLLSGKNVFRATASQGQCVAFDDVTVTVYDAKSNAGNDQTVTKDSTYLFANFEKDEIGSWICANPQVKIANPSLFNSKVQNLQAGANLFRWTTEKMGCKASDEVIVVYTPTMSAKDKMDTQIKIYPNPVSDFLSIEMSTIDMKNTSLTVFDINGRKLKQQNITSTHTQLELRNLPAGVYMLRIQQKEGEKMLKFVKE